MANQGIARALEPDPVGRLARYFPGATPMRIPILLGHEANSDGDTNGNFLEETFVEFGTQQEMLFVLRHPLDFGDRVRVESKDGSVRAEASVVAVQYHPERTVVAVRFLKPVSNWIVKS